MSWGRPTPPGVCVRDVICHQASGAMDGAEMCLLFSMSLEWTDLGYEGLSLANQKSRK